MRSASRAKSRLVSVPSMAGVFLPVRHSSHVPKIWTTECAGVKLPDRRDLLERSVDVGADELGRTMAGAAHEMKVAGPSVRRFVAKPPFAEIHPTGDAIVDHALERPVDRGAADAGKAAPDGVEELVGADVSRLVCRTSRI